jgi:hypothetical protein
MAWDVRGAEYPPACFASLSVAVVGKSRCESATAVIFKVRFREKCYRRIFSLKHTLYVIYLAADAVDVPAEDLEGRPDGILGRLVYIRATHNCICYL